MPLSTRVDPIDRDIDLIFKEVLSPEARSKIFADEARKQLVTAEQQNQKILGRIPPHKTFVDGSEGQSENDVRPDGVIVYEFQVVSNLLKWVADQLALHAPVGSGRDPHPGLFKSSFTLYADGVEVAVGGQIPDADEFVFLAPVPYSRKIEGDQSRAPQSLQAPDGVFQVVAELARQQPGSNWMKITFTYRTPFDGKLLGGKAGDRSDARTPAIIIRVR